MSATALPFAPADFAKQLQVIIRLGITDEELAKRGLPSREQLSLLAEQNQGATEDSDLTF
jgi:hypothetical protein